MYKLRSRKAEVDEQLDRPWGATRAETSAILFPEQPSTGSIGEPLLEGGSPKDRAQTAQKTAGPSIAAGSPATVNVVAQSIGEILCREPEIDYLPPRAGDIRDSWARIDMAREVLGFEPSVQLDEGLARTVRALVG